VTSSCEEVEGGGEDVVGKRLRYEGAVRSGQIERRIRSRRQIAFSVGFIKIEGIAARRLEFGGSTIRHSKRYFHFTPHLFPASLPVQEPNKESVGFDAHDTIIDQHLHDASGHGYEPALLDGGRLDHDFSSVLFHSQHGLFQQAMAFKIIQPIHPSIYGP
jgi:hypothetical protein